MIAFRRRMVDHGAVAVQQFGQDILPLLLLFAISVTGLMLTASYTWMKGYAYDFLAILHAATVIVTLLWLPFAIVLGLTIACRRQRWWVRYSIVLGVGWVVLVLFTHLYWEFAIDYAPTEELQEDLMRRDGGPRLFAFLFGWLFAGLLMAPIEIARAGWLWLRRLRRAA